MPHDGVADEGYSRHVTNPKRLASLLVALALAATPMPVSGASIAAMAIASTASSVPAFSHIYVIVMENKEYGSIVGSTKAPYINYLIRHYGLATNYTAITHPSQPNYLALWGGSTFGIRDNAVHNIARTNIADQLVAHGRTWHVYAQDLPKVCSTVATAYGGVDLVGAAGWYARKHEPAISFTFISHYRSRCSLITRLSTFNPTAANLELIVPNMTNDMHDGTIAKGDAFLKAFVPRITGNAAFANSLLVITWDEGTTSIGGGGHVATVVISHRTPAGTRSATAHNHYSLVRTIENAWGLGCMRQTCYSNDLGEFFP